MTMFAHRLFLSALTMVVISAFAGSASAAVFTANIFDLENNPRTGQVVTVTVTPVDANGNVVANPAIRFDADIANATRKNVTAGSTVVTVNDARVSAVTFTFTGAGLQTTVVQRLRNFANIEYDVAVPKDDSLPTVNRGCKSHYCPCFLGR